MAARTSILCTSRQTSAVWWLEPFAQHSSTEGRNAQLVPGCTSQTHSGLRLKKSSWMCTNRSKWEMWGRIICNNNHLISIYGILCQWHKNTNLMFLQPVEDFGSFFSAVIDDKVGMNLFLVLLLYLPCSYYLLSEFLFSASPLAGSKAGSNMPSHLPILPWLLEENATTRKDTLWSRRLSKPRIRRIK